MKKISIILFLSLSCTLMRVNAQEALRSIDVSGVVLSRENEQLKVSFHLATGEKAIQRSYILTLTPVFRYENEKVLLPSIEIQGKKAAIMQRRYTGIQSAVSSTPVLFIPVGGSGYYETVIPYSAWMVGVDLVFDTKIMACQSIKSLPDELLAAHVLVGDTVRIVNVTAPIATPSRRTIADLQAEIYPFVAPIAEFERARADIVAGEKFDDNMLLHLGKAVGEGKQEHVERFVERNKPGSLMIYYTQAKSNVDPGYRGNWISVEQLIRSVRAIEQSEDSRVERIVIAGFASPEGILENNDRLSWERALAVKEVILNNTPLSADKIRIFNGSEDWLGLRSMVSESMLPEKEEVIRIIDTFPREEGGSRNGRLEQLKRLNGGSTYRYLYVNYFPDLRNAAYIKVYYENIRIPE